MAMEWRYIIPSKDNYSWRRIGTDPFTLEFREEEIEPEDVPDEVLDVNRSVRAKLAVDPLYLERMFEDSIAARVEKPRYG
jgi:hypothetical protein